jgi:flagellar assembly factor FliW
MPQCLTKYHGEIEYDERTTLHFARGLFGFEEETRFLSIEQPVLRPLVFLQSLSTPDLCFVALPVFVVDKDYFLSLDPDDLKALGLPSERQPTIGVDVLCLAIVCIPNGGPTTANLLAPVIVNLQNSQAIQAVSLNRRHSHKTPLPVANEVLACS